MKLLVFAHTPPPHHGQSFMVQAMLKGFGGDWRKRANRNPHPFGIQCYHVNSRVSKQMDDIGDFRIGKILLTLGYCAQAIYCRFRYGVENFYYVPAPGKPSALYRDWLVMALCRIFFKRLILHWHASGLGKWLETISDINARTATYKFLGRADLSIVLSNYGQADAAKLYSSSIAVVGNGIDDPCPAFKKELLPMRKARLAAREQLRRGEAVAPGVKEQCQGDPTVFKVLFMSHCSQEKGLFETIEGVRQANEHLKAQNSPIHVRLTIAGTFMSAEEKGRFDQLLEKRDISEHTEYVGYVSGPQKTQFLRDADVFCFPSYLESFGLVLAEAMAFGLPIITTSCGALPEVAPPDCQCTVPVGNAEAIAAAVESSLFLDVFEARRERFVQRFTLDKHIAVLANTIKSVEANPRSAFEGWEIPPATEKGAMLLTK